MANHPENGRGPSNSTPMVVDFKLLRRAAATNFRDLGGYPTAGGRSVRRGMVHRSAHLAKVPRRSPLRALGLRTVVTLQSRVEVRELGPPDPRMLDSLRWEHIPIGDRWFTDDEARDEMRSPERVHLALVTQFVEQWREFFHLLADADAYPLLFHCSAGRDRTGVGAAMLLDLLGVGRSRIVADFLQSNKVYPRMPLSAAQLDPVFRMIDRHGGASRFMREAIGLESREIAAIRRVLLTD